MKDKSIYIIGGGPSLKGFDFQKTANLNTLVINHAAEHVINPSFFLTADSGVIRKAAINNFWKCNENTHKIVVMGSDHKRYKKTKQYFSKYDQVVAPIRYDGVIGFEYSSFATGKNSGFCGLQYAIINGYTTIYLMGFDLQATLSQRHFYDKDRSGEKGLGKCLSSFHTHFKTALNILVKSNISIFSLSPTSLLNDIIPFKQFKDTLS
jgi:hypothetical protein